MARAVSTNRKLVFTVIGWSIGFLLFFPILWTVLTSFKSEGEAIASPPSFLFFHWTTENYAEVQSRSDYFKHFGNSVIISFGSTLLGLIIAIPAAWAMAFSPTKRTKDILMWMLSTKMLPAVGVLVPIYLLYRDTGLLDTRIGLVIMLTMINLPIIVWMLSPISRTSRTTSSKPPAWTAPRSARRSSMCWCRWPFPASPRRSCSTSSSPGTRRSGRST
jgi:sorbitol/mannitol transport system permease protein